MKPDTPTESGQGEKPDTLLVPDGGQDVTEDAGVGHDGGQEVTYYAWCGECDWSSITKGADPERVQEISAIKMFSHGLNDGHPETFHKEVEDEE